MNFRVNLSWNWKIGPEESVRTSTIIISRFQICRNQFFLCLWRLFIWWASLLALYFNFVISAICFTTAKQTIGHWIQIGMVIATHSVEKKRKPNGTVPWTVPRVWAKQEQPVAQFLEQCCSWLLLTTTGITIKHCTLMPAEMARAKSLSSQLWA